MKFLITGNMGYIGSVLTEFLLCSGYRVVGIDNFTYKTEHIAKRLQRAYGKHRLEQHNFDLCNENYDLIDDVMSEVDGIIHLAALVGEPICKKYPELSRQINVEATRKLVDKLSKYTTRIIGFNTNSGLGDSPNGIADETSPMNPCSLYGNQKLDAERLILSYPHAISLRLATICGLSWRTRLDLLVNTIAYEGFFNKKVKLYEGEFTRNYVSINDVVRVVSFTIENFEKMRGQIYNVGMDTENCTKRELCHKIQQLVPFEIEETNLQDPDRRNYRVSSDKLARLGFTFKFTIKNAVEDLIEWFKTLPVDKMDREQFLRYNYNTAI